MSKIITDTDQLKEAIKNKEESFIVTGKLAHRLRPLSYIPKSINIFHTMTAQELTSEIESTGTIAASVIITLVITVGIITIIAIIKDYDIKIESSPNGLKLIFNRRSTN